MSPDPSTADRLSAAEWRATATLALVYGLRMLGMFMILPVFAVYAGQLAGGAQGWQIGLAIGAYGLTQALLQMPMGAASDRFGRKPVIVAGLLLFAAGSLLAGLAGTIEGVIAGRALQGAGAISAAVTALLADSVRASRRTTAMAVFGAGMGGSFLLAMILGPVVAARIGVDGIFLATAAAAVLLVPLVLLGVHASAPRLQPRAPLRSVLQAPLLVLYAGVFALHASLTALFVAAPHAISETLGLPVGAHWKVWLPVMALSLLPALLAIRAAERRGRTAALLAGGAVALAVAGALAAAGHQRVSALLAGLALYFAAFNVLEAALPARLSRIAPGSLRGTAIGVFATAQFLGAFAGGLIGGTLWDRFGAGGTFAVCALLPVGWLALMHALRVRTAATMAEDGEDRWQEASTK